MVTKVPSLYGAPLHKGTDPKVGAGGGAVYRDKTQSLPLVLTTGQHWGTQLCVHSPKDRLLRLSALAPHSHHLRGFKKTWIPWALHHRF